LICLEATRMMCKNLQHLAKLEASYISCSLPNFSNMHKLKNLTELRLEKKNSADAPWAFRFNEPETDTLHKRVFNDLPQLRIFNSVDFETVPQLSCSPHFYLSDVLAPCELEECMIRLESENDP